MVHPHHVRCRRRPRRPPSHRRAAMQRARTVQLRARGALRRRRSGPIHPQPQCAPADGDVKARNRYGSCRCPATRARTGSSAIAARSARAAGFGRRYLVGVTMPADEACPDCGTMLVVECPACGETIESVMQVDCRACGAPLRPAGAVRRRDPAQGRAAGHADRRQRQCLGTERLELQDAAALDAVGGALECVRDLRLVALAVGSGNGLLPATSGRPGPCTAPPGRPGRGAPWPLRDTAGRIRLRQCRSRCRSAPGAWTRGSRRPRRPPWWPASSWRPRQGRELVAEGAHAAGCDDDVPGAPGGFVAA